ncbi:SPFH domain-containing protein [Cellulosimicrobium arenosum]|uniref:SPFH domain-containing protein n=1 Tax=Cellulosimicrobium arenosum TaxID=2708133 RepID=A0A927G8M8_9MICO|nr:SPFH domain-containing protein [Cellulosimicrobium arenosum]MBD8078574.1 SPFH domain-containing protein [Cellulosimicrobium arenosum]
MTTIRRYPGARHFLGSPTGHVVHLRRGRVAHQGVGQAFWFRPSTTVLSEVPVDDQELPIFFHAVTADHQDVTVQANVTYRFTDPVTVAQRLDFAVDARSGETSTAGRDQVAGIVGQLAQSHAADTVAAMSLADAMTAGVPRVRGLLTQVLPADPRLAATGIAVIGVQVLAVRPEKDVERALQTPAREHVQAEADRATYERRALAVERERVIAENELASQIELATRREHLVAQEGANARRTAREKAAAGMIDARGSAERATLATEAQAEQVRAVGAAEAAAEQARMEVYGDVGRSTLVALALRDAARSLPTVQNLTITPDLLTGTLGALLTGALAGDGAPDGPGTAPTGKAA